MLLGVKSFVNCFHMVCHDTNTIWCTTNVLKAILFFRSFNCRSFKLQTYSYRHAKQVNEKNSRKKCKQTTTRRFILMLLLRFDRTTTIFAQENTITYTLKTHKQKKYSTKQRYRFVHSTCINSHFYAIKNVFQWVLFGFFALISFISVQPNTKHT